MAEDGIGVMALVEVVGSWRETKFEGSLKAACHPRMRETTWGS
jgi:hypothetical protein